MQETLDKRKNYRKSYRKIENRVQKEAVSEIAMLESVLDGRLPVFFRQIQQKKPNSEEKEL